MDYQSTFLYTISLKRLWKHKALRVDVRNSAEIFRIKTLCGIRILRMLDISNFASIQSNAAQTNEKVLFCIYSHAVETREDLLHIAKIEPFNV